MVPTDPMREWMAPYSKYALLNQGPQTQGSHLKMTAQTAVCALANIKTSQCFSRNLFEGGQFLESLVVSYFDCKLLSINVSSSNSTALSVETCSCDLGKSQGGNDMIPERPRATHWVRKLTGHSAQNVFWIRAISIISSTGTKKAHTPIESYSMKEYLQNCSLGTR